MLCSLCRAFSGQFLSGFCFNVKEEGSVMVKPRDRSLSKVCVNSLGSLEDTLTLRENLGMLLVLLKKL